MVMLRLMRAGAKKRPSYRIVAADSRRQRDGRFLEILGHYNPIAKPHELVLHKDRIDAWISKGARPTVQVASLMRSAGISVHAPKTVAPAEKKSKVAAKKAARKTAKKAAVKRAKPSKPSERKTRAKAARAKKKNAPKA